MQTHQLSLHHLVRPSSLAEGQPPLLIVLHGYGANERDLFSFASYLDPRLLVISVRAPLTVMQGAFAWFAISWTNSGISVDRAQAETARNSLILFIEEAISAYHADPAQVYLLGFSQGAIMSAAVLLRRPDLITGAALMSGSATADLVPADLDRSALDGMPVLITHGTFDNVLPIQNGRASRELFSRLPVALTYREYPMGHEVNAQSLADVVAWFGEHLV